MGVLLYFPASEGIGEGLQEEIERLIPPEEIEIYRTREELYLRLLAPKGDLLAVILLIPDRRELLGILSLRELLQDLRIFLLLPDREEDTISKGHILRPRFLGYADGDPGVVIAVLKKILGNAYRAKKGKEDENRVIGQVSGEA